MVERTQPKPKPQTHALAFCVFFGDIGFLLALRKHEKFHIPSS